MVASTVYNQDFATFKGDTPKPIFTVVDSTGTAVDISAATEITWTCRRDASTAAAVTLTKTGGAITFVSTGTDGKFQVALSAANTNSLDGFYLHAATVVLAGLTITTEVGRLQCVTAPDWTYNPALLSSSDLYQIRLLIGDTQQGDKLLADTEITFTRTQYSNNWLAGAACCRAIALKLARAVDISEGGLRKTYSQKSKAYQLLAVKLEADGYAKGAIGGYAGGISRQDVQTQDQNTDRVQPEFTIGWTDNMVVPVGPVGHIAPLGNVAPSNTGGGG